MRASSASSTRRYSARRGGSIPKSFSAAIAQPWLLMKQAR